MDASDLHMVLVCDRIKVSLLGAKLGEVNVDRSSQCSTKVSGARGDVT